MWRSRVYVKEIQVWLCQMLMTIDVVCNNITETSQLRPEGAAMDDPDLQRQKRRKRIVHYYRGSFTNFKVLME